MKSRVIPCKRVEIQYSESLDKSQFWDFLSAGRNLSPQQFGKATHENEMRLIPISGLYNRGIALWRNDSSRVISVKLSDPCDAAIFFIPLFNSTYT